MQQAGFPGCCGIYVIYGFPNDAYPEFQPDPQGALQKLEFPNAMTLVALTNRQLAAQGDLEAVGYVAVGRSSGIHANGTAITLFAKGLSPIVPEPKKTPRPRKVRTKKAKSRRK